MSCGQLDLEDVECVVKLPYHVIFFSTASCIGSLASVEVPLHISFMASLIVGVATGYRVSWAGFCGFGIMCSFPLCMKT